ncbi:MAG: citrate synthase [Acidimicrobiaceae bacterium]|nr:citrate synthase [Acidimicrobiaceae bacterium]
MAVSSIIVNIDRINLLGFQIMAEDRGGITTAEAARRLGVKQETLYAYVSRGLLTSRRTPGGRGSMFDAAEVEALATGSRRAPKSGALNVVIASGITEVTDGMIRFRGLDAVEAARTLPFEAVAAWLWSGTRWDGVGFSAPSAVLDLGRRAASLLPPGARSIQRLQAATIACATADPLAGDVRPASAAAAGRVLLAVLAEVLPVDDRAAGRVAVRATVRAADRGPARASTKTATPPGRALASRLWPRLTPLPPTPSAIAALNGALVLLADHDLATSTFAARVAASTRASPYAVVAAGLAALDGWYHGAASAAVHDLFVAAGNDGVDQAIRSALRADATLPGFGHPLHPTGDPRAGALLEVVTRARGIDRNRLALARRVLRTVERREPTAPNIDAALATLAYCTGMARDAGEAIFAIARTAGWIAHAIEEYSETPLRLRPQSAALAVPPVAPSEVWVDNPRKRRSSTDTSMSGRVVR